jgi:Phosphotransferase enzyme family
MDVTAAADRARALLDRAVERVPVHGHEGRSGALLERIRLADGQQLIAKRLDPVHDLTMRISGDLVGREFVLWRDGVLDRLPDAVGHAVVAGWNEPRGAMLLLRDVTPALAPERISRDEYRRILAATTSMHRLFAGEPVAAACPLELRLGVFAPQRLRRRTDDHGLAPLVQRGWELFADVVPGPVVDAVLAIHDDPAPLAKRLTSGGFTLLHGDLWLDNIALEAGQVTLLDWELATNGPPALDFVWFLTGSASRVEASHDDLVDDVREVCRPDEDTLRLALLAGLAELGWNKALNAIEHHDAATRAHELDDLAWWVRQARAAL